MRVCTLKRALTLSAVVVACTLAGPAAAQNNDRVYQTVRSHQEAGRHARALSALERKFGSAAEWPIPALIMKAESLAATEKGADAFALLAGAQSRAQGEDATQLRRHLQAIGRALPPVRVTVRSAPDGGAIEVDGDAKGQTPSEVMMHPGHHKVRITLANHGTHEADVFVEPNKPGFVSARLAAQTGAVTVEVDQDGLSVRFAGKDQPLTRGKNTIENVPAGALQLTFWKDGKEVHRAQATIPAGGTANVSWLRFAVLRPEHDGATLELVKEPAEGEEAAEGEPTLSPELQLDPGTYTVIMRRPGHYPVKGTVTVGAGQSATLVAATEAVPDRSTIEIASVVGLSLSIAMIATATVLELSDVEADGGGPIKFTLAGVGGAMLITSGSLLKWVRSESQDPSPHDGTFQLRVGGAVTPDGAMIGASGSF